MPSSFQGCTEVKTRRMLSYWNTLGTGCTNLFGVFEVLEEGAIAPGYTLAHVGGSV